MSMRRTIDASGALSLDDYARKGVQTAYDSFISSVNDTLATLPDPRDRLVVRHRFGLVDGKRATLESVRHEIGISRERVRQLQRIAVEELRSNFRAYPFRLLAAASSLKVWGGLVGERPQDAGFSFALAKIVGGDKSMIDARIRFLDELGAFPPDERTPLSALDDRVFRIFVRNIDPVSLDALKAEITEAAETLGILKDWPHLDITMRLNLILGVEITDDGVCVATEDTFLGTTKMEHRLGVLVSVLAEAGKPLHFRDITRRAAPLLPGKFALSERNVHARLDRHKKHFRWAGMGTFALTEWDIGVRDGNEGSALRDTRRKGIGDEIALILLERGEPMLLSEIEDHILNVRRIEVIPRSVAASVASDKARRFASLGGGYVGLADWRRQDD